MVSTKSKFIDFFLRIIRFKEIIKKMAIHPSRNRKQFVPNEFSNLFALKTQLINAKMVATLEKKDFPPQIHIIYLHGGAYVFESSSLHWGLVKKLLIKIPCRISVIDYPLAPEKNFIDTLEMVRKSYEYIIEHYPEDEIVFMGDSAGGGLALSFTQMLMSEKKLALPHKLILLSPWIDLTLENPEIKILEKLDVQLSCSFLKYCAGKYSNDEDLHNYLLSPIFGPIKELPSTAVFYGTHELFVSDINNLKERAQKEDVKIEFFKYKEMQHDWILLPIPEAERAISEICDFIMN